MAVTSAATERTGLPKSTTDPSLSKLASEDDVVSNSSASPNDLSPTDTPDRNDNTSNSSPNPNYNDIENQSPSELRSEEYRQLFRLPPEEFLVQDFNCAFQENILFQGHMYLFVHYICFYSNIFGFETKKVIAFNEITSVNRAKTAGIFPNAIEIFAGTKRYFFASFLSRDEAFKIIKDGWLQYGNVGQEITEQQESMSESGTQENGVVAIENIDSSKNPVNDMESADRHEDVPTISGSEVPPSTKTNVEVGRGSVINAGVSEPEDTYAWKPENCDAPKVAECFTKVAETKFPIKVEEFFNLFFSDNAVNFIESFHKRCGDKDFRCSSWSAHDKFGHIRDVSFQHPIKIYFGAKFGSCQEAQKFRIYRNSHLVIETSQEISDVPYGDYFRVEALWDVERDSDSPQGCVLRVYVNVAFSKRTVWKGKIVQSTLEECREAYATWIDMAHELLKQNIDKPGGVDPSGISPENGEVQVERLVATTDPSERSHLISDPPVRTLQMPDSVEVNQRIRNLLQESLSSASSITFLIIELTRKSYSYLKNQGHISLVLAVAFTVIFLMQVSIVVLLNRPHQVHVSYPVEYMSSMMGDGGGGSGSGESRAEAVAWLEKRMHHLKEEMTMVEARLERMWHEHAALKAQLKEVGYSKKHSR